MISIRPARDQLGQPIDVLGVLGVEPLHQRAAGVQGDLQRLVAGEHVEERPVAVLVGLLEDVVEIADRLVVVQGQDEADGDWACWRRCYAFDGRVRELPALGYRRGSSSIENLDRPVTCRPH